jgi:hypothetical protein
MLRERRSGPYFRSLHIMRSAQRHIALSANSADCWTRTLHGDWTSIRFGKHCQKKSRRRMASALPPANGTVSAHFLFQRLYRDVQYMDCRRGLLLRFI